MNRNPSVAEATEQSGALHGVVLVLRVRRGAALARGEHALRLLLHRRQIRHHLLPSPTLS